ncbi:hypothetical protein KRR40_34370 [Niabella defluvii]|nr:hypothetical protein KRR40_34370 [Niabella sp. I65]
MKEIKLNKLAKYGTIITCIILVIVALFTWLIRYPETVNSEAKLTGTNAPKPIIAFIGKVTTPFEKNGDQVKKDDIIGCVETTADIDEVLKFENFVDTLYMLVNSDNSDGIQEIMRQSFSGLGSCNPITRALCNPTCPTGITY